MKNKKILVICISVFLAAVVIIACVIVVKNTVANDDNNASVPAFDSSDFALTNDKTESDTENNSNTDNNVGLRNVKIDSSKELTEEQKILLQYFDNDYITIADYKYEFLARYPSIFEGTQVHFTGTVEKIIKSTDKDYELLVWVGPSNKDGSFGSDEDYQAYKEYSKDNLIIIRGEQTSARFVLGDEISVYGRYNKIETLTVDGISYTTPTVNVYRTYFNTGSDVSEKFDADFIKKVAVALFGNDAEVRNAIEGEEYDSSTSLDIYGNGNAPYMICEPENQSNSKFTKYRLYLNEGAIEDAKSKSERDITGTSADDSNIIRKFEFTPDLKHYLVYTFDTDLESLSVGYYDKNFQKIWQRDFEETINAVYDYTQKNFYIVANNDLYIIDIATGNDVISPSYVGEKTDIRKVSDGLIMFNSSKSDSVMKINLEGDIVWKTNIPDDIYASFNLPAVQFVGEKIIIDADVIIFELNAKTGKLVLTGELQQSLA